MSTTITSTFDVAALRAAIEGHDPAALADLYTDDCVVEISDHWVGSVQLVRVRETGVVRGIEEGSTRRD